MIIVIPHLIRISCIDSVLKDYLLSKTIFLEKADPLSNSID